MKYLLIILFAVSLTSCRRDYNVKLANGSIVVAGDSDDRSFKKGDTVCVRSSFGGWGIDNAGVMKDTTIIYRRDNKNYPLTYKIGVIR